MHRYIFVFIVLIVLCGCGIVGNTKCSPSSTGIEAEREWYSFKDSVEQADLIVEVEIVENSIINGYMCKTKHTATVLEYFGGESEQEITFLQEGGNSALINGNGIFQPGERYILMLKETVGESAAQFWILGDELSTYKVDGDSLIRTMEYEELQSIEVDHMNDLIEDEYLQIIDRDELINKVKETGE
ncbi:hypothetical protein [Alkalicoccobacillus gibsonii]|uniref:hypothetical protein n=1 Tax=Alkalicoccobacillus gibsonii TaxID=79881 RepID=UPI003511EF58